MNEFSGKFNVRVPKMLHSKLVRLADEQGVSLNSLVQTILMSGATVLASGQEFGALTKTNPEGTGAVSAARQQGMVSGRTSAAANNNSVVTVQERNRAYGTADLQTHATAD